MLTWEKSRSGSICGMSVGCYMGIVYVLIATTFVLYSVTIPRVVRFKTFIFFSILD